MIEVAWIDVEEVAMRRPEPLADVDDVEPCPRSQFEGNLDRGGCHEIYGVPV
jgi:hypothetical protein